jgi:transposase
MAAAKSARSMPTGGRRSKLDPERTKLVVEAISLGCHLDAAAAHAGISRTTFWRWMQIGEEAKRGPFRDFYNAVRAAEARLEVVLTGKLRTAADRDWRANLEFMARRFPERWGTKDRHQVDVTVDADASDRLLGKLARLAAGKAARESDREPDAE